ncbi:hypothetical protein Tco_1194156, partial [Tanacetum coccineum]
FGGVTSKPQFRPTIDDSNPLLQDPAGYAVNAEIGFGAKVSAFFLLLSYMDQNICSGVRFLWGAKVARKFSFE